MRDGLKKIILLVVVLLGVAPIFAQAERLSGGFEFNVGTGGIGMGGSAPEPRLLSPGSETLDLTGKDTVEFKWSPFEGRMDKRKQYDFRLYKGYEQYQKNEISRKTVPPNEYSVVVKTDMFVDGQVYTWAVRQVYYDRKSDWAYNSFKVVKKGK